MPYFYNNETSGSGSGSGGAASREAARAQKMEAEVDAIFARVSSDAEYNEAVKEFRERYGAAAAKKYFA